MQSSTTDLCVEGVANLRFQLHQRILKEDISGVIGELGVRVKNVWK